MSFHLEFLSLIIFYFWEYRRCMFFFIRLSLFIFWNDLNFLSCIFSCYKPYQWLSWTLRILPLPESIQLSAYNICFYHFFKFLKLCMYVLVKYPILIGFFIAMLKHETNNLKVKKNNSGMQSEISVCYGLNSAVEV